MKTRTRSLSLFLLLALAPTLLAAPDKAALCRRETESGQKLLDRGDSAGALKILETAVADCRAAGSTSGRAYLLLGTIYFRLNALEKASELFEESLKAQPKQALARMNLGACQMIRGQFDPAIETTRQVLTETRDKHLLMQANFNLGLAFVKKALAFHQPVDAQAQKYFLEGTRLEPKFGGNYHYLGLLQESIARDFVGAKRFYRQGCERRYPASCELLASADRRALSSDAALEISPRAPRAVPPGPPTQAAPVRPLGPDNEARLSELNAAYSRKYDAKSAVAVTNGLRHSCELVSPEQCRTMLDRTLTAVQ